MRACAHNKCPLYLCYSLFWEAYTSRTIAWNSLRNKLLKARTQSLYAKALTWAQKRAREIAHTYAQNTHACKHCYGTHANKLSKRLEWIGKIDQQTNRRLCNSRQRRIGQNSPGVNLTGHDLSLLHRLRISRLLAFGCITKPIAWSQTGFHHNGRSQSPQVFILPRCISLPGPKRPTFECLWRLQPERCTQPKDTGFTTSADLLRSTESS